MQNAEPLENLADQFARFSGIGRKGAVRMAYEVMSMSNEQAMELALVENLQREDLDPVEEATGIRELMTRCDLTQEQAARKLGKSRSALANSLRLLNLPENVLELLKSGFINIGHAKVILGLPTPELQEQAAQALLPQSCTLRENLSILAALCRSTATVPELLRAVEKSGAPVHLLQKCGACALMLVNDSQYEQSLRAAYSASRDLHD